MTAAAQRDRVMEAAYLARHSFAHYCAFVARWPLAPHQRHFIAPVVRLARWPGQAECLSAWPQAGKTSLATALASQWLLGQSYGADLPGDIRSIILASYNERKAHGLSRAVRAAFEDPRHPARWVFPEVTIREGGEGTWCLSDQPANEPSFVAIGVGGGTGYPAQCILIDDWVKGYAEATSLAYQDAIWEWHTGTILARMQAGTRVMVTATRWMAEDYVGRLLQAGGFQYTAVPAETGEGERRRATWPERFPLEHLDRIQAEGGARNYATLYLCTPTPAEGLVWRRDWFDGQRFWPGGAPDPRELAEVVTAWDATPPKEQLKRSDGDTDFVGYARVGRDRNGHFWVLNAGRRRMTSDEMRRAVAAGCGGGLGEAAVIERDANGRWLLSLLRDCGRSLIGIDPIADKITRAKQVSHLAETSRIHVCDDESGEELLRTLCAFPNDAHDDEHDALVHALRRLYLADGKPAAEGAPAAAMPNNWGGVW